MNGQLRHPWLDKGKAAMGSEPPGINGEQLDQLKCWERKGNSEWAVAKRNGKYQ